MSEQVQKVKRSTNLIKGFMLLVMLVEVLKIIDTDTIDLGSVAGTCAILALLRSLLGTPELLITPLRQWLRSDRTVSKESKKYFFVAVILMIVSMQ